jgi:thiol peroxidase
MSVPQENPWTRRERSAEGEEHRMATITLKGNPIHTSGTLPPVGAKAPDFKLTRSDLADVSLADFAGRKKLINIVPSLDTGVCAASTRRFNQEAARVPGAVILVVSCDLPFAQKRFCDAEGIGSVVALSELRERKFGEAYGVRIVDGPLAGLFSRAVVVLDEKDKVVYTEQVPEIASEPDYAKALAALGV